MGIERGNDLKAKQRLVIKMGKSKCNELLKDRCRQELAVISQRRVEVEMEVECSQMRHGSIVSRELDSPLLHFKILKQLYFGL